MCLDWDPSSDADGRRLVAVSARVCMILASDPAATASSIQKNGALYGTH
jgi:hypothetical protein